MQKKRTHLSLLDASERYGKVFSFWIGKQFVVALTGFDAIQQALMKQAHVYSDRSFYLGFHKAAASGIMLRPYCQGWKTLRQFTLHTLRDFGVGKTSLEEKISLKIDAAYNVIDASENGRMEIRPVMQKLTGNILYNIIFGKRFEFDGPEIEIINRMTNISFQGGTLSATRFLPTWVTRIVAKAAHATAEAQKQNFERINNYVNDQIKRHEETFAESSIRDFIDLFIEVSNRSNDDKEDVFTSESMFQIISELFVVGAETTYNTLDWAFLFMAENPEIQGKCYINRRNYRRQVCQLCG